MMVRGYQQLVVWQRAVQLVAAAHQVATRLPLHERFGLASQMRRPATSVAANIAEGHARVSVKEFLHFLSIARGSVVELETHLLVAERVGYLDQSQTRRALALADEVSRMVTSMRLKLADQLPEQARRSALGGQHTARKNSSQSRIP